ncbi:MAG: deoxyribodipyrimidine photo-lyase [Candidatus Sulfotelmatobacter sp.]
MVIKTLSLDPRVTVRKPGAPNPEGECVVYWMQRAQRALDNPALDVAVELGNELRKPVVAFLAPVPFYPRANLRHYRFLASGLSDIEEGLSKRNVGFVLRTYPDHSLIKFCEQVRSAIVIGDENFLREPEYWRVRAAQDLKVPLWTVDADVIVPRGCWVRSILVPALCARDSRNSCLSSSFQRKSSQREPHGTSHEICIHFRRMRISLQTGPSIAPFRR